MTTRRRARAAATVTAILLAGVGGASPLPSAAAEPGCAQPYEAVYGTESNGGPLRQVLPAQPVVAPGTTGDTLTFFDDDQRTRVDTNGDGQPDTLEIDLSTGEQQMVVTRADGVVRVGLASHNLGEANSYRVGDLDGDGRDEIYFLARPAGPGEDLLFILPGGTAPGTYQATDVAIRLPDASVATIAFPVGDQLAGTGEDLAVANSDGSFVTSGSDVMAVPAGGTLAGYSVGAPLEGYPSSVLVLGQGRPTIASISTGPDGDSTVVLWHEGVNTRYRSPVPASAGAVSAEQTTTGPFLLLSFGDRGGSSTYWWNLSDPCTPLPPASAEAPPTAAPADPVSGPATFTG